MSSLHPSSKEIIQSGIFNNLNNFEELKKRISQIKSLNGRGVEKTKGDIFEIFCEAILNINQEYQTKRVYPQEATPLIIRKKLNLPHFDDGWDGVYETHDGKFATYQAKYRTDDKMLRWQGENGLSSTIAKGQRADIIHLITNVTRTPSSFSNSDKVLQTLGNNLKTVNKLYFKKIEKWLNKKNYEDLGLHKPDKYQEDALNKIKLALEKKDRTTIVMACGSGKTDIGVWEYLRRKPNLAIVFVPSIALVKQIRADWLSQIPFSVITFQVCSSKDSTKKEDALVVRKKDLDMKISTNDKELQNWITKNKTKNKIIFSTYQSSEVLNSALKKRVVDFAVFDEAHRTATVNRKVESYFSNALFDKNIKIKKRLFMTATRRVSSKTKMNKEGDRKIDVNMDNKELYGDICYKLSFTKAAKEYGCIAIPKVIISEIFSDEVDNERTRISSTHVDGEKLKTDYLANIIAIKKTIEKYKIKKVFTFHNSIKSAEIFTTHDGPVNIGYHLDNFYSNYIKGEMNMRVRDEIMNEFRANKKSILANQRCLIEGVDVPEVNMVVFNTPKQSEVDIVQAIGRALRNRNISNKKYGYILIPVLVERKKNETHANAISRANYDKVAEILNAIKEHDDEIAQIIKNLIISKTRGKGFTRKNISDLSDFIETNHPEISEKILNETIASKIVDKLKTSWDERISELVNYKERFGNFDFIRQNEYIKLRNWISDVRRRWRKGNLLGFQIDELESIGITKYPKEVTIFGDNHGYYTKSGLSKLNGVPIRLINLLVKRKLIKPVGKGIGNTNQGVEELYKPIKSEKIKKILKIDFLEPRKSKYQSIYSQKKHIGLDVRRIKKFIKDKKIKPAGYGFIGEIRVAFYKIIKRDEIFKYYKCIEKNESLVTVSELANHLSSNGRRKITKSQIERLTKRGLLKIEGKTLGNAGRTNVYKKISIETFTKITGITLFETKGLIHRRDLAKSLNISPQILQNKLINKKIIIPKGIAISNKGTSPMFSPIGKIEEKKICKKLNIDFLNKHKLVTLDFLSRKLGVRTNQLLRILKFLSIRPVGKGISHAGISEFYNDIKPEFIKKELQIDLLHKDEKEKLETVTYIQKRVQKLIRISKNNKTIEKKLNENNIQLFGKGFSRAGGLTKSHYYKKIPDKILIKIFKN